MGSNGGTLLVTPHRDDAEAFLRFRHDRPAALGVELIHRYGGTSGRFAVAETIARAFPAHMDFARQVAAEGVMGPLPGGPYPDDRIVRLSPTEVEFTTPAGTTGLGTRSGALAREPGPIRGTVILYPDDDMFMVQLSYRLAPRHARQAREIMAQVHRSAGLALGESH